MTSKLTREQLHERARENVKALKMASRQHAFESAREEILADLQLAKLALAAMDSDPVLTLEVAREDYKGQKLGKHFGFITLDAARELKEGNYQLYTAQPAPVVPDRSIFEKWWESQNGAPLDGWDSLRTTYGYCDDGIDGQFEAWNAAMLAAAPQEVKP